ncbi:hypothetical protein ANO11243_046000 [Dothideomycetidae sp. 11243]|nr:hypothetical protein ANO11243_046000 [fungal sp. No.11243]
MSRESASSYTAACVGKARYLPWFQSNPCEDLTHVTCEHVLPRRDGLLSSRLSLLRGVDEEEGSDVEVAAAMGIDGCVDDVDWEGELRGDLTESGLEVVAKDEDEAEDATLLPP